MGWGRRFRAIVVVAAMWAVVWLPIGIGLGVLSNDYSKFAVAWTVWGAVSGGVFAILLMLTESGRSIRELSLGRVAVWGALGCMTLPLAFTALAIASGPWVFWHYDWITYALILGMSAALGAVCAAGTVAAVRRNV
jgi:hypothetical protein